MITLQMGRGGQWHRCLLRPSGPPTRTLAADGLSSKSNGHRCGEAGWIWTRSVGVRTNLLAQMGP